jgi:hypothetical protein
MHDRHKNQQYPSGFRALIVLICVICLAFVRGRIRTYFGDNFFTEYVLWIFVFIPMMFLRKNSKIR